MELKFDNNLLNPDQIKSAGTALGPYLDELSEVVRKKKQGAAEYSLCLSQDKKALEAVLDLKQKKVSHELRYVVVLGIGGSNLGTKAIYDAMRGFFDSLKTIQPKMLFADTCDPAWLSELASFLEKNISLPEQVLLVSVMKSGRTNETVFNTEYFYSVLKRLLGEEAAKDRLVFITGDTTDLWRFAGDYGISRLSIPLSVGGRYSVLSPVGLFPLAAVGLDIRALLEGAHSILDHCIESKIERNSAAKSAVTLFMHSQAGKHIHDTFVFHPELESLGKWYRQLLAESTGKEKDLDGKTVRTGIMPTVSVGSVDLHSLFQLYIAGPKNRMTTFVYSEKRESYGRHLQPALLRELSDHLAGKRSSELMGAIASGVRRAYQDSELPFIEVNLPGISEYSLGQFMQWKMVEVMLLAKLLNVNAFDQPGVEMYKKETERILSE